MSKKGNIALWMGRVLMAILFVMTGSHKLMGDPIMVDMFDKIGFGLWFRYFTGGIELCIALLLLVPRTSFYGALLGVGVMVGAFFVQLTVLHGDVIHTIVIGAILGVLVWAQRPAWTRTAEVAGP